MSQPPAGPTDPSPPEQAKSTKWRDYIMNRRQQQSSTSDGQSRGRSLPQEEKTRRTKPPKQRGR